MKMKAFFVMVLGMLVISGGGAFAGVLDWSKSDVSPADADTIRVFGLIYSGTPGITYNLDFKFNETTLKFEPVLPTSVVTINESKLATADAVRGGVLYDKWWKINGQAEPTSNHPFYPSTGKQSGKDTWRCKECHGWDYKGKDGAYVSGSHYTGIKGVYEARNMNAAHLFAIITKHNLSLSEQDIWDLTRFIKESLVEMDKYVIFNGTQKKSATGDVTKGKTLYENTGTGGGQCIMCHGADGTAIKFDGTEGVGDVANDNPWETLQKIRFGHPGSSPTMPSAVNNGLSITDQNDILTYGQTLPKIAP
ncbi:MAG: hypothetical protein A3G93_08795 [Nitrospinae bacterium RIFCSPLOWO2_12_FULL_45_22]|nr:MAG: hypothetical protein A3G93_08795 [Nitrospinae bacterium RIFCSPLOWO2_12_FULL_45_22]